MATIDLGVSQWTRVLSGNIVMFVHHIQQPQRRRPRPLLPPCQYARIVTTVRMVYVFNVKIFIIFWMGSACHPVLRATSAKATVTSLDIAHSTSPPQPFHQRRPVPFQLLVQQEAPLCPCAPLIKLQPAAPPATTIAILVTVPCALFAKIFVIYSGVYVLTRVPWALCPKVLVTFTAVVCRIVFQLGPLPLLMQQ